MANLSWFYTGRAWAEFMTVLKMQRTNERGEIICEYCGKPITKKYDCIGHHKIELTEQNVNDVSIALNPDNIALLHHVCHNRIHNKLGYKPRNVYLIYGAPCSGKNTYVSEIAERGDLIIDMDNIWQCISGQQRYIKPPCLNDIAFSVRDTLLEGVKYRRGRWLNCYIIGGYPLISERERICKELGARPIFIEATEEECLSRLGVCNDGRNINDWKAFVKKWFENFSA